MKTQLIIERVQSLYSRGVKSDDSRLTQRHIYNKLVTLRAKLITQQIKKRQKVSQWNYQTMECVELIKAPQVECPCLPPKGCQILKTKTELPKPLVSLSNHQLQSVSSIDGDILFSEVTWTEKKYKSANKYTAKKPDYYIRNGHLYITQPKGPKVISITGLFNDPEEVYSYPSYCDDCIDCDDCISPLDREFPIDLDMIDTLIEMAVQELVMMFSQMIEDRSNDTRNTEEQQTK